MNGNLSGLAPTVVKISGDASENTANTSVRVAWTEATQSVGRSPAASASPGNLLEMQIPRPHPRPTETDSLDMGPRNLDLNKPVS